MNGFSALITVVTISLALSGATVFAIHHPLRKLLEAVCPLGFTAQFWTRAAVTVLFLLPLWVVLVFGLPGFRYLDQMPAGEIARRALAAASFALVGIVVATGFRLSNLRAPSANDYPPPVR
jgi:Trk-type K+ transport system membrane component